MPQAPSHLHHALAAGLAMLGLLVCVSPSWSAARSAAVAATGMHLEASSGGPQLESLEVVGRALDPAGEPVSGARVLVVEDDVSTTTDEAGAFQLDTFASRTLLVEHPAFQPSSVSLISSETGSSELVIELEPLLAASDSLTVQG